MLPTEMLYMVPKVQQLQQHRLLVSLLRRTNFQLQSDLKKARPVESILPDDQLLTSARSCHVAIELRGNKHIRVCTDFQISDICFENLRGPIRIRNSRVFQDSSNAFSATFRVKYLHVSIVAILSANYLITQKLLIATELRGLTRNLLKYLLNSKCDKTEHILTVKLFDTWNYAAAQ